MAFLKYKPYITSDKYIAYIYKDGQFVKVKPYIYSSEGNEEEILSTTSIVGMAVAGQAIVGE